MKQLLSSIKERISEKIDSVRYIDEDWGQLDYYAPDHPVKWPCVLIDISQVRWSNQGKHLQTGIAEVAITVADMKLSNTNRQAPAGQSKAAGHIFDLLQQVFASLHGWAPNQSVGPLTRTLTRKISRDDGIRQFEVVFAAQITDQDAIISSVDYPMTEDKIKIETNIPL